MRGFEGKDLDVICQCCHDGKIIPIRIRITEDGDEYAYTIKEYKQTNVDGAFTTPDPCF